MLINVCFHADSLDRWKNVEHLCKDVSMFSSCFCFNGACTRDGGHMTQQCGKDQFYPP